MSRDATPEELALMKKNHFAEGVLTPERGSALHWHSLGHVPARDAHHFKEQLLASASQCAVAVWDARTWRKAHG